MGFINIIAANCWSLKGPTNGGVNYDRDLINGGYPEGTKASYYCNLGYSRLGSSYATCWFNNKTSVGWSLNKAHGPDCRGKEIQM